MYHFVDNRNSALEMNKNSLILQGSFPGGRPHSTVLLGCRSDYISLSESARTVQALMRHPNNITIQQAMNDFNRGSLKIQCYSANNNVKTYPLNVARLNFQNEGTPIEEGVLQLYECVFKTDLRNVRIHEGGGEAETIGAIAFAIGKDIYFAEGMYNPHTPEGQKLLGHELTHVIQQKEGRVKNPFGKHLAAVYDPGLETEADRIGFQVYNGFNVRQLKNSQKANTIVQLAKHRFKNYEGISGGTALAMSSGQNVASLVYCINGIEKSMRYRSGEWGESVYYQSSTGYHGLAYHDAEMNLVSWCINDLVTNFGISSLPGLTGTITIDSNLGPCNDCRKAIKWLKKQLPNVKITVMYRSDEQLYPSNRGGLYGYANAKGSRGLWTVYLFSSPTCNTTVTSCCTSTTTTTTTTTTASAAAASTQSHRQIPEPAFEISEPQFSNEPATNSPQISAPLNVDKKKSSNRKQEAEMRRMYNEIYAAKMAEASSQSQVITQRRSYQTPQQPPQQQLPPPQQLLPQHQPPQQRRQRAREAKDSSWCCPCTIL